MKQDRENAGSSSIVMTAGVALLALGGLGCGSNAPDIPPELLEAIEASGSAGGDYPEGPYGTREGEIAPDTCFSNTWLDPKESAYDPAAFETLCFSDFYDPDGEKGIKLLLVNTGALWCTACKTEWGGGAGQPSLLEHQAERFDQGFRIVGSIFQDAAAQPAKESHAIVWAETYEVDFPFALDDTFVMGQFADPDTQPFNMLIDTTTMEILLQVDGDQPAVLWSFVDERL